MNIYHIAGIALLATAILLIIFTLFIGWLKSLQKERFKNWTFLDYISVGYARHLYIKYVKRQ